MMSMQMSDSSDLLSGRRSNSIVNFWRSRTQMERILLVAVVVLSIMLLGFIIGVATLHSEIANDEHRISHLTKKLEECEAQLTTVAPLTTTTAASEPTTTTTATSEPTTTMSTTMSTITSTASEPTTTMSTTMSTISSTESETTTDEYTTDATTSIESNATELF